MSAGTCGEHGDALIHEAGGDDMPTLSGRTYCPTCQERLFVALDALRAPIHDALALETFPAQLAHLPETEETP